MASFTVDQLAIIAATTIDFHKRGGLLAQQIDDKPTLKIFRAKEKTFPGGKENITIGVKGFIPAGVDGYENDDTVTYVNNTSGLRASYPYKELHEGMTVPFSELKRNGITIVDTAMGLRGKAAPQADKVQLANLLTEKQQEMAERWASGWNNMLWDDGTAKPKGFAGIPFYISDTPAVGTVGGISRVSNTWWRNIAQLGIAATTANAADQILVKQLTKTTRQLYRYGGKPDVYAAGSDFLDQLENEARARGNYTQDGWSKGGGSGNIKLDIDGFAFKGKVFFYEPRLDLLGKAKYCYMIDSTKLRLMGMEGEVDRVHTPARPPEKYAGYQALTYTGGTVCDQLNAHAVLSIA